MPKTAFRAQAAPRPAADRMKQLTDLLVAKGVITAAQQATLLAP